MDHERLFLLQDHLVSKQTKSIFEYTLNLGPYRSSKNHSILLQFIFELKF